MKYKEALDLKEKLRNNKFKSTAGNELTIIIAPADKEALNTWKKGMSHIWNERNPDPLARYYTSEDDFILYGVRQLSQGGFSGGELNLKQHPELKPRANPNDSKSY